MLLTMKYDFSVIREAFRMSGWTLEEWAQRTGLHYTTLSKALDRESAHQKTAKAMAKSLKLPYAALIPADKRKSA